MPRRERIGLESGAFRLCRLVLHSILECVADNTVVFRVLEMTFMSNKSVTVVSSEKGDTGDPAPIFSVADLAIGESGVLVSSAGPRVFRRRLLELGLVPGTRVVLVNVAPLGDPLELEVRGCRLSIRKSEAIALRVRSAKDVRRLKVVS